MKKNGFFFGLLAAVAMTSVFTSCSNDEGESLNNVAQPKQLTLKSQVSLTRSTSQSLQTTQIASGVKVGAYVVQGTTPTSNGNNVQLTADGLGNFTGGAMTWPTEGSVNIYAYAPYSSSYTLSGANAFSIQTDQSSDANYLASDLLYGVPTANNPVSETSDGTVPMTFAHKLTKLNINITNNNTEVDLKGATVKVMNTLPTTSLTLTDGSIAAASGSATDITAATFATDATSFNSSAIIVPQTIASGTTLVKIEPVSGTALIAKLGSEVTFAGGKSYTYTVTINAAAVVETELTLTNAQVTDWDSSTDALNGTAEEYTGPVTYGIGDYVMTDGTLLKASALTDANKANVAAIIFSTTVSSTDATAGYGAYAMSVKRYGSRKFTAVDGYTTALGDAVVDWYKEAAGAYNDYDGRTKTATMLTNDYYTTGLATDDEKAAFIANMGGISSLTAITGQGSGNDISEWFLPSFGQMVQLLNQFGEAGISTTTCDETPSSGSVAYTNTGGAETLVSKMNAAISTPLGISDFLTVGDIVFATSSENGGTGHQTKWWGFQITSGGNWAFGKNFTRGTNGRNVIPVVAVKLAAE